MWTPDGLGPLYCGPAEVRRNERVPVRVRGPLPTCTQDLVTESEVGKPGVGGGPVLHSSRPSESFWGGNLPPGPAPNSPYRAPRTFFASSHASAREGGGTCLPSRILHCTRRA